MMNNSIQAQDYERILLDREKRAKQDCEQSEKKARQDRAHYEYCKRERINWQLNFPYSEKKASS